MLLPYRCAREQKNDPILLIHPAGNVNILVFHIGTRADDPSQARHATLSVLWFCLGIGFRANAGAIMVGTLIVVLPRLVPRLAASRRLSTKRDAFEAMDRSELGDGYNFLPLTYTPRIDPKAPPVLFQM